MAGFGRERMKSSVVADWKWKSTMMRGENRKAEAAVEEGKKAPDADGIMDVATAR